MLLLVRFMNNFPRKYLLFGIIAFGILFGSVVYSSTGSELLGPELEVDPILFVNILFFSCILIGIFAVLAGVGGGVIFTPLMLGFTPIDSYIVRSTGLFIAMVGSIIAGRQYLRYGIANYKLVLLAAVPYTLFAVIGALIAGYLYTVTGEIGESVLRGLLGLIVIAIGLLFIFAGKQMEYPEVDRVDSFTAIFDLGTSYEEKSLNRIIDYKITNLGIGMPLFCVAGLISGMFGLGAGWAIVPIFNLAMMVPLKVAATCSTIMISIGDSAAVWPYILGGGLFPIVTVPCMSGMIIGAFVGSRIMVKVKPGIVRWLIIGVMFLAGIRLIIKALTIF